MITASAQVPNPVRQWHPSIAEPAFGVIVPPSPHLAVPDGVWNHGEGFDPNPPYAHADYGGWHLTTHHEKGLGVTDQDVHTYSTWSNYDWTDAYPPLTTHTVRRFVGYLRPQGLALPTEHPLYGPVAAYVDQGAFEVFTPVEPVGSRTIVVCVMCRETIGFPLNANLEVLEWRQTYRGIFSPDGLARDERDPPTAATFALNTDPDDVDRPPLGMIRDWSPTASYWPVLAWCESTVMHRSTTLNEQRYMELVQAIKHLLARPDATNPVYSSAPEWSPLTPAQIEDQVVVVFLGGSNGGLHASWAVLNHPELVHGCWAEVINPSMQRLLGEQALGHLVARMSGDGTYGAAVRESDFLIWNQYTWPEQHIHDLSYPRLYRSDRAYRPACFVVGDEDITTTGVDWVPLIHGTWAANGRETGMLGFGDPSANAFSWAVVEATCHTGALVPALPGVPGATAFGNRSNALGLVEDAVAHRLAEVGNGQQGVPQPAPANLRTAAQQTRGLDDPHEWFLGRKGRALPSPSAGDPLVLDSSWTNSVQGDSAGSMPGAREAMVIANNSLYVGSADGVVSRFLVGPLPEQALVRVAKTAPLGRDVFAMAFDDAGNKLIAGSRRHLYRLHADTLEVEATSAILPWEVAQLRHMRIANVLPDAGHSGPELIFHSVHGGLVFYDPGTLAPIWEWPEPGILDIEVEGSEVVLLSTRGVVAGVTFAFAPGSGYVATLTGASQSIPTPGVADMPTQGIPHDLELMVANFSALNAGTLVCAISSWSGDTDGESVRAHAIPKEYDYVNYLPASLRQYGSEPILDLATCGHDPSYGGGTGPGDHVLVLSAGSSVVRLSLYDQYRTPRATTEISTTSNGFYPFAMRAHSMVVGELVANPTSGGYTEEVVVATNEGLVWMHIDELVGATTLPAAADVKTVVGSAPGTPTHLQPRTNRTLASAWALWPDPANGEIHVLDQRGVYWRVGHDGTVQLHDATPFLTGTRQWSYVGTMTGGTPPLAGLGGPFSAGSALEKWVHDCWCPKDSEVVAFERNPAPTPGGSSHVPNNWVQRGYPFCSYYGFVAHRWGGASLDRPNSTELWDWTAFDEAEDPTLGIPLGVWSNSMQGIRLNAAGVVDGAWASVEEGTPGPTPGEWDKCPHLDLAARDFSELPMMTQQSVKAVVMTIGGVEETVLAVGCPGGRVRFVQPGQWRDASPVPHTIGTMTSSIDFGYGGSAIDVRVYDDGGEDVLKVWFGTVVEPCKLPGSYGNDAGALADGEVMAPGIHVLEWRPSGGITYLQDVALHPGALHADGAYGVVGMRVADLLTDAQHPGDELVVGTISGDLILYSADTMQEVWRTHVPGSVGWYNSILVEDLDGDSTPELYVGGSFGLWRFDPQ